MTEQDLALVDEHVRLLRLIRDEPGWALARVQRATELEAEVERAVFLFGALGHGGEHDRCDPCEFVRHSAAFAEDRVPVCPECWATLIGPHEGDKWCPHCEPASDEGGEP